MVKTNTIMLHNVHNPPVPQQGIAGAVGFDLFRPCDHCGNSMTSFPCGSLGWATTCSKEWKQTVTR